MSQTELPILRSRGDRQGPADVLRRTLCRLASIPYPPAWRPSVPLAQGWRPLHATTMVFDVVGFGGRSGLAQFAIRREMYRVLEEAIVESRMPRPGWAEDRGDGVLIVFASELPTQRDVDLYMLCLAAGLRRHNRTASADTQIRLRMAVGAGLVHPDQEGLGGEVLVTLCRMLDAQAFKDAIAGTEQVLAVIVSQEFHLEEIAPGWGILDPGSYRGLTAVHKETVVAAQFRTF